MTASYANPARISRHTCSIPLRVGLKLTLSCSPSVINISNYDFKSGTTGGTNILGLLVFSIVFGIIISKMGEETRILVKFFEAMNVAVMKLTGLVIW
jgi:Na+/H+-dicarboxylate symporter